MKERLITSLLLFFIVCVLITMFIFSEKNVSDSTLKLLTDIEPDTISKITIERKSAEKIEFLALHGNWVISSPINTRANMTRIAAILNFLQTRSFTQIKVLDAELQQYQLDFPETLLLLDEHKIEFGSLDPIDNRRYVKFNNTIHIVSDNLFHQLQQAPVFFVNTHLIPEEETIASIEFTGQLLSKVSDIWSLSPINSEISEEQLHNVVRAWQNGQASQIVEYSATETYEKIIVRFNSGRAALFDVISTSPALILGRSDLKIKYHLDYDTSGLLVLPKTNKNEAA